MIGRIEQSDGFDDAHRLISPPASLHPALEDCGKTLRYLRMTICALVGALAGFIGLFLFDYAVSMLHAFLHGIRNGDSKTKTVQEKRLGLSLRRTDLLMTAGIAGKTRDRPVV